MKTYQTGNIRNVVLLGSSKSGKTTLSEAMMFEGKVIDRRGSVEAKNTISDNTEIEQINQRSIYSTPLYTEFMDNKLNIMDTPGADDFIGGVISAFKVCDSGILVVNAQQGVEVGTEIFARYASDYKKPLVVAVNQLDAEKASWESTIDSLREAFGNKVVLVQFPVAVGAGFNGFIDVLTMKMYTFTDDNGTREEHDIPDNLKAQADEVLAALTEMAAESDEALMEKYFDAGELSREEIEKGLNLGFLQGTIMPAFCVSARKDIGVKKLMEFMINVAPSPGTLPPTERGIASAGKNFFSTFHPPKVARKKFSTDFHPPETACKLFSKPFTPPEAPGKSFSAVSLCQSLNIIYFCVNSQANLIFYTYAEQT